MTTSPTATPVASTPTHRPAQPERRLTADRVWHELGRTSFAVLTHVTPQGEPRSSGVVHVVAGGRLFVAVAPDSWKARQIEDGQVVSITVPVRRGGLLSLLFPIPPATITFQARAVVHRDQPARGSSLPADLRRLVPADRRDQAVVIELVPEGRFVTFGIGVSLNDMRRPDRARADVPVSDPIRAAA